MPLTYRRSVVGVARRLRRADRLYRLPVPGANAEWVEESRNIYEDYKAAFGEEPPKINGVAIMSDTDNTKERTVAYYGNIQFVPAGQ